MVSAPRAIAGGRQGMTRLGCLFALLLVTVGLYYGVNIGGVYLEYWRFKEEMKSQARLAPSIDDDTIRRRLIRKIEEIGLPDEARNITVRRTVRPREILIRTSYRETLELPFYRYTLTLTPEAKAPL